jgi:hypothetical protein
MPSIAHATTSVARADLWNQTQQDAKHDALQSQDAPSSRSGRMAAATSRAAPLRVKVQLVLPLAQAAAHKVLQHP